MKLLVCSFGGVASKTFIKGVVTVANKQVPWHHGHYRVPPGAVDDDVRVVYLFGNPLNAIISFFNRRVARSQLHGFGGQEDIHPSREWALNHCRNLQGEWQSLDSSWGLEEYLDNGKDLFGLEDHFSNWHTAIRGYPILSLKYETLWGHLGEIAQFLEIPEVDTAEFPPQEKRGSDWKSLSGPVQKKLYNMYGGLYERIQEIDEFSILHGGKG